MKKEVIDCILKNIYKLTHTPRYCNKGQRDYKQIYRTRTFRYESLLR